MRRALALAAALLLAAAPAARAQVDPSADYRTIATPHFRIHYALELEPLARRAAASAERAWGRLSAELAPPRGPVDIVLADNVDYSNGFATTFPSNRIVLYATPPVDAGALRNYADWMDLVVTHELVHVFHLDRSRGVWRLAQRVLGRNPALFPNTYVPSWLTEGLAVYYESRLTGSGRLAGTPHRVQALASAMGGGSPRLDQLSASTPAFPGGNSAYVWGSLAVERLAGIGGDGAVRRFVEATSLDLVPFRLDHAARRAFGESFTRAWATWRDSLAREAARARADSGWATLARDAWDARAPRLAGDASVLWAATFAREVPALWAVDTGGRRRRLARRNSLDVNAPAPGGGVVYAQLEFTDAFRVRSDLWVERGGTRRRLTRGARLLQHDVRADGAIVAVQLVDGTTRLVRLTERAPRPVPITAAHPDTQWSEPRWAGAGDALVAVRRTRGGRSEVVRLDSAGAATVLLGSGLVEGSPVLAGDDCTLWSVSDRRGRPEPLALADACTGAPASALAFAGVPAGTAGVLALDAGDGREAHGLAALAVGARGYALLRRDARAPAPGDSVPAATDTASRARALLADTAGRGASARPARPFSPWRTLLPTWWLPLTGQNGAGATTLGAYSSGSDVVGRHAWSAQALVPVRRADEWEGAAGYRWRGLGQPALDIAADQSWDRIRYVDQLGRPAGTLAQRNRTVSVGVSVVRPRFYTGASAAAGFEHEWNEPVRTDPDTLLPLLARQGLRTVARPGAYLSLGWSALQRAPLATGPEDGLSIGVTGRQRWQDDLGLGTSRTAIGVLRGFRSLPLPGYARHVLAARLSGAWASDASTSDFGVGGTSGASIELLPGIVVGDVSRAFGVRGFPPDALVGNRALGGVLEYRAPLLLANRGAGLWPLYLSRTGLTLFADAASAWCSAERAIPVCRRGSTPRRTIASAGGELWLDASASYDVPYRIRAGVAAPLQERALATGAGPSVYVSFGVAF